MHFIERIFDQYESYSRPHAILMFVWFPFWMSVCQNWSFLIAKYMADITFGGNIQMDDDVVACVL